MVAPKRRDPLRYDFVFWQLKILAIDGKFEKIEEICISFDKELQKYKTKGI